MKSEESKVLKRTVIPIQIVASPNIAVALNFHKPCKSSLLPATTTTNFKKVKIPFRSDVEKGDDIKRGREIKSYEITVNSNKYPDSRFNTEISQDIKRKEAHEIYFSLKAERKGGKMKVLDGYAEMSEKIIEKKTVALTFNQKLKIQESMLDNRMRREYTEKEVIEMFDDDNDLFDR